jgi:hypothetical protein
MAKLVACADSEERRSRRIRTSWQRRGKRVGRAEEVRRQEAVEVWSKFPVSVHFSRFPVIMSESMANLIPFVPRTVRSNPSSTSHASSQFVIGQAYAMSTPTPVCRHFHCLPRDRSTPSIHPTDIRTITTRCASSDIYASHRSSESATHSHSNLVPVFPGVFVFEISIVSVEEARGIGSGDHGTRRDSVLLRHRQTRRMHLMEACVYGVSPCAFPTCTSTDSSSP